MSISESCCDVENIPLPFITEDDADAKTDKEYRSDNSRPSRTNRSAPLLSLFGGRIALGLEELLLVGLIILLLHENIRDNLAIILLLYILLPF
jgi:hypothetical protein